jgi:hypothetical protein
MRDAGKKETKYTKQLNLQDKWASFCHETKRIPMILQVQCPQNAQVAFLPTKSLKKVL